MENAILVGTHSLDELRELAVSDGARIIDEVIQRRDRPDSATYIGKGKVEELREQINYHAQSLVPRPPVGACCQYPIGLCQ